MYIVNFPDYLSKSHIEASKKLLHSLNGVKLVSEEDSSITIEVEESMVEVLEDLSDCDYISIIKK